MLKEFKEFAVRGSMLDMAVGIIIGAAFGKIVTSLVGDVLMPIIGVVSGGVNFSGLATRVGGTDAAPNLLKYGAFVQAVIDFLIVAFVIMALAEHRWALTGALMIQGFGMGLAGPGFMSGASLAVSRQEQGAVAGVAGSCGPLGFTIGPLLGGLLYQVTRTLPYATAAVIYVILLACMPWLGRRVAVHRAD